MIRWCRWRKGKAAGKGWEQLVDSTGYTTMAMTSAMIACFPVDLPAYVPSLMAAWIPLLTLQTNTAASSENTVDWTVFRDMMKKLVMEFKRTHQDMMQKKVFKELFTQEQYDALQGMSSHASYFL